MEMSQLSIQEMVHCTQSETLGVMAKVW